jgi:hypothetical protein
MNATINPFIFDTLAYSEELRKSGFNDKQAEAITKATSIAIKQIVSNENLATKGDILEVKELINASSLKTIATMSIIQAMIIGFYQFILHI